MSLLCGQQMSANRHEREKNPTMYLRSDFIRLEMLLKRLSALNSLDFGLQGRASAGSVVTNSFLLVLIYEVA
jgi:hypothetical protein